MRNEHLASLFSCFLATLSTLSESSPMSFKSFCVLQYTESDPDESANNSSSNNGTGSNAGGSGLQHRLMLYGTQFAYIYTSDSIMCVSGN